jgi:hypothetical protein
MAGYVAPIGVSYTPALAASCFMALVGDCKVTRIAIAAFSRVMVPLAYDRRLHLATFHLHNGFLPPPCSCLAKLTKENVESL